MGAAAAQRLRRFVAQRVRQANPGVAQLPRLVDALLLLGATKSLLVHWCAHWREAIRQR
jgi:hypothetical protein